MTDTTGKKDEKRQIILEAAESLFIEKGYASTSISGVAAVANASKATIYARFSSKEDLFSAVILFACRDIEAPLLTSLGDYLTLEDGLLAAGRATLFRIFQPRGMAVLEAAIGAKFACPEAMGIYWKSGPGVAEAFVESAIVRENARRTGHSPDAKIAAKRFMNLATAPFLYSVLFAGSPLPSRKDMDCELVATVNTFISWLEDR